MSDAVLDANVLLPKYTRWSLLWVSTTVPTFTPRWSKRILQETYTNLILRDLASDEEVRELHRLLLHYFPDAWIDQNDIDDDLAKMTNDRKDRHVLAAAALVGSDTIVTNNIGDFPPTACALPGLTVTPVRADDFLEDLAASWPEEVEQALEDYAGVLHNPHDWSLAELLGALSLSKRLPKFAAQVAKDTGITPAAPPA